MMPTNGGANASAWAWAGLAVSAHQHKAGRRVIIASFGLQLLLFQLAESGCFYLVVLSLLSYP